jgi:hypothetical protein
VAAFEGLKKFKMAAVAMVTKVQKMLNSLQTVDPFETRIFVFWRSFWIQNGHHSKPKWLQYGAACLTPYKYPFPFEIFSFLNF